MVRFRLCEGEGGLTVDRLFGQEVVSYFLIAFGYMCELDDFGSVLEDEFAGDLRSEGFS